MTKTNCLVSFPIALGRKGLFYMCPGSHHFFYHDDVRKRVTKTLGMEEVITPSNSVFTDKGSLQHADGEWWRKYRLRYHTYQIPEEVKLKDAIAFT